MTTNAIDIRSLSKSYGAKKVLTGLDLAVPTGSVLALLGPNGAGKTTTVEILQGLRRADSGSISVLGTDPRRAPRSWRAHRRGLAELLGHVRADGRRGRRPRRLLLRAARRRRGDHRARRTGRRRPDPGIAPIRWSTVPARRGAGYRGASRAPFPRRADHGFRPRGAPRVLGSGRDPRRLRPTQRAASALVTPVVLILQFVSGIFFPLARLPSAMVHLFSVLPVRWSAELMRESFLPSDFQTVEPTGSWETTKGLVVVAAWLVAGVVAAVVVSRRQTVDR